MLGVFTLVDRVGFSVHGEHSECCHRRLIGLNWVFKIGVYHMMKRGEESAYSRAEIWENISHFNE